MELDPSPQHILFAAMAIALFAINLFTYGIFRHDKIRSLNRGWRVPERTLLTLAVFGGWPAAKLAQRRLRHKTRKQPFAALLNLIGALWALALFAAAFWPHWRMMMGA